MKYLATLACLFLISAAEANYTHAKSGKPVDSRGDKVGNTMGSESAAPKGETMNRNWRDDSVGTSQSSTVRDTDRAVTSERCVDSNGIVFYRNDDGYRNCVKMNK